MRFLSLKSHCIVNLEQVTHIEHNPDRKKAILWLVNGKLVEIFQPEDYQKLMTVIDPSKEPPDPPDNWVPFEVELDDRPAVCV